MKRSGRHLKGLGRKLNRIKRRMEYMPFGWTPSAHLLGRLWHNCRWDKPNERR